MDSEVWKKVDGFEYMVSSKGRVKSLRKNMILKPDMSRGKYPSVILYGKDKSMRIHVHRLVAEYFIPNPEDKPMVDHINTIRDDNRVENLRWVTAWENINNPITLKKHCKPHSKEWNRNIQKSLPKIAVICVETQEVFESLAEAERKTKTQYPNIVKVLKGQRYTAGGFHWKPFFYN